MALTGRFRAFKGGPRPRQDLAATVAPTPSPNFHRRRTHQPVFDLAFLLPVCLRVGPPTVCFFPSIICSGHDLSCVQAYGALLLRSSVNGAADPCDCRITMLMIAFVMPPLSTASCPTEHLNSALYCFALLVPVTGTRLRIRLSPSSNGPRTEAPCSAGVRCCRTRPATPHDAE